MPEQVPLTCSVNGVVVSNNVAAFLNSQKPVGYVETTSWQIESHQVDWTQPSTFHLQWTCSADHHWQFSHPNGSCSFSTVYNSSGATCSPNYDGGNPGGAFSSCTCQDSLGATKQFPYIPSAESPYCTYPYGEPVCLPIPGTCDGKTPQGLQDPRPVGSISLSCPANATAGRSVTCNATMSGMVSNYWLIDGVQQTLGVNAASITVDRVPAKVYQVQVKGLDARGSTVQSSVATVNVSGTTCTMDYQDSSPVLLAEGDSVKAYFTDWENPSCHSQMRTCRSDGTLSGSYQYRECYSGPAR